MMEHLNRFEGTEFCELVPGGKLLGVPKWQEANRVVRAFVPPSSLLSHPLNGLLQLFNYSEDFTLGGSVVG